MYKSKDKFIIYLPQNVVSALGLKEGDDIDFLPYSNRQFVIAKKSDLIALLEKQKGGAPIAPVAPIAFAQGSQQINDEELSVLKKMDKIRYGERTKARLLKELTPAERKIASGLIKRKVITTFKKPGEQEAKYGIAKSVYNAYLLGKRERTQAQTQQVQVQVQAPPAPQPKKWEKQLSENTGYLNILEANGFIVVANQGEASTISAELEESIRRGLVVGTRAFNKKYYITLKSFVSKNAAKVMKAIGSKGTGVQDISKETGIDEEGVRAILYMLAEGGDVSEAKRDFFKVV